ncbi:MAG: alginate lyase family protein, partial [Ferruginibacter sp.]
YDQLIKTADQALKYKPVSVMDKTDLPPSGDKHDYMSIAPYWWPDQSKPNGIPYIRKDGEVNPEVLNFPDKENMPRLCENIYNLALAYYFTDNEIYAKHASKLIKVWFLDSATAMNPNLNYGQAVKGVTDGRAEGLIEVRHFIFLLDGITLLKNSENFKEGKLKKLKKWFVEFSSWMQTSKVGKDEMEAKNNHGVWFDATSLAIANFIEDKSLANAIVERAADRLDDQMDENGFFPLELARTTSLHYSTFILDAFTNIAQLSENTDTNFWVIQTKSKKSLEKGYTAILPFWANNNKWTYKEIKPFASNNAYQCIWRAAVKYKCTSCKEIIKKSATDYDKLLINLL